jgi:hypothetical protein
MMVQKKRPENFLRYYDFCIIATAIMMPVVVVVAVVVVV